jgi:DNA-binding HxlR family transcriptional regulator/peroxiredoxin
MTRARAGDSGCSIGHALDVVGGPWTLLVVRELAGRVNRFSALVAELGISRKVLTETLEALVGSGVAERRQYAAHPPRFEYHLTAAGLDLMPVLVALQNWGSQHVLGDGTVSATTEPGSVEARRVHGLVGSEFPQVRLAGTGSDQDSDPLASTGPTVVYFFPGAYAPGTDAYPPNWSAVPGAPGCTAEARAFRDLHPEFATRGVTVRGVSTQRLDQLRAFAAHERLPFELLSDQGLVLSAALRLPTFRAGGADRLKRLTLLVDEARTIRAVLYPILDPAGSAQEILELTGVVSC